MVNLDKSDEVYDYIHWLLNKSIWSYEVTENDFNKEINKDQNLQTLLIYYKHILIPSLIRDALKQLIKDSVNIDKTAPKNLTIIAEAIIHDPKVKDYMSKIAKSLGLIEMLQNH